MAEVLAAVHGAGQVAGDGKLRETVALVEQQGRDVLHYRQHVPASPVGQDVQDFKYNAALYYEMHDEVVPALKLFEECGKTERIKNLLIRNARMNPGNGHYYELRRYYFNLDEREIADSPVLMAGVPSAPWSAGPSPCNHPRPFHTGFRPARP